MQEFIEFPAEISKTMPDTSLGSPISHGLAGSEVLSTSLSHDSMKYIGAVVTVPELDT